MPCVGNQRFSSDRMTYVEVLVGYFVIHMAAHLCTRCGLLPELTHCCMAIDISGCVDP